MNIFAQIGLIAILMTITAIIFLIWLIIICVKAINKHEREHQEDRELLRKPKEIIITIRNESDKDKIIKQIIESEASNDQTTFKEKYKRR